jgi:GNAT superfamily N-acetyltransferase
MLRIRSLKIEDVPLLHQMILEFATFEHLAHEATLTTEALACDAFGSHPRFRALLPEWNGEPAGYAMFFPFYSSFQGPGLFLEDIYVREPFRGQGIGKALMAEVAAIALRENLWALRWEVLQWNQAAIDFYKKLGARFLHDWMEVRIEGENLRRLAESAPR